MATHSIKTHRLAKGWSQAELAERAGISRAAVSAIEMNRLVPSVSTALALAAVFECSVEELFASPRQHQPIAWAWQPAMKPSRYWHVSSAIGFSDTLSKQPVSPACHTMA